VDNGVKMTCVAVAFSIVTCLSNDCILPWYICTLYVC